MKQNPPPLDVGSTSRILMISNRLVKENAIVWEYRKTSWVRLNDFVIKLDEVNFVKSVKNGIEVHFKNNHIEIIDRVSLDDFFSLLSKK